MREKKWYQTELACRCRPICTNLRAFTGTHRRSRYCPRRLSFLRDPRSWNRYIWDCLLNRSEFNSRDTLYFDADSRLSSAARDATKRPWGYATIAADGGQKAFGEWERQRGEWSQCSQQPQNLHLRSDKISPIHAQGALAVSYASVLLTSVGADGEYLMRVLCLCELSRVGVV